MSEFIHTSYFDILIYEKRSIVFLSLETSYDYKNFSNDIVSDRYKGANTLNVFRSFSLNTTFGSGE